MTASALTNADRRSQRLARFRADLPGHVDRLTWDRTRLQAHQLDRLRALLRQAKLRSPFHAERLAEVDPGEVVTVTTTGPERVIITKTGTEMLTIDTGVDEMVQVNPEGGSGMTVINTSARALVVVNPATHEAVAVIPANQEVTLSVVKKSR